MNTETLSPRKAYLLEKARTATRSLPTPVLVMDRDIIRQDNQSFRSSFPGAGMYYALKANSDPAVASLFHKMGTGFEVGSEGALRLLFDLGVPATSIVSGNPLKTPAFLKQAHDAGVRKFTYDSSGEIEKVVRLAPASEMYVRIAVSNNFSEWPLDKKFGVDQAQAVELLVQARQAGLDTAGIAFHVGSQCVSPAGWTGALQQASRVWQEAAARGIELRSLNLGGGFPTEYTRAVPSVPDIASAVYESVDGLFPAGTELLLEPGRGLVGEAGVMVTTVIARASREGQEWVYLDAGVFNGLMESIGGIKYPFAVEKQGNPTPYIVAGPSCDSMDVLPGRVELPSLEIGDRVYILSAGAYTTAYASQFDGIAVPRVVLL